jgi:hypothetical protein
MRILFDAFLTVCYLIVSFCASAEMLKLSILGVLFNRLGNSGLYVGGVGAPISAVVFLTAGVRLLRRPKAADSKSE